MYRVVKQPGNLDRRQSFTIVTHCLFCITTTHDGFGANNQDLQHIVHLHAALLLHIVASPWYSASPGVEATLVLSEQFPLSVLSN